MLKDKAMSLLSDSELGFLTKDESGQADAGKTREELRSELESLRKRLADVEGWKRRMEKEYKESEDRFWSFFRGNDTPKLLLDPDTGEIVDFNQMACAFYGYSPQEMSQANFMDLTPLPEQVMHKELHRAGLQWIKPAFFMQRLAGGGLSEVEVSAGPVYQNGRKLILCLLHDSSAAQRAIEALKHRSQKPPARSRRPSVSQGKSESKEFETLLDCVQTHICYFIDPYTYGMANKTHADFLGIEKKKFYRAKISDILDQDLARQVIEENKKIFSEKIQVRSTKWMPSAQGESRLLSISKTPVFDPDDKVVLVVCTAQDITRVRQNQEALKGKLKILKSKVMIDGLTNIPNRRYLDQALSREWGRAKRDQSHLSLLILDIDNFKEFNDNYGHVDGDKVLQRVSNALAQSLTRPGDIIARYGGEEFVALLPQTDVKGAKVMAEKMRSLIEGLKIKHEFSPVTSVLTVSIGGASIQPLVGLKDLPPEILLRSADRALYQAKQSGKNRAVTRMLKFNGTAAPQEDPDDINS
ncbi:diguanylate cyclase [Desulfonatronovibrio hydrogenovorans]|uniref:diguanylate cyclase n=1 Tax=Desulfonatronovibrio hydrogenovorans TaxID=53245 RepID=UPI0006907E53|nr:diguanylate cyclase [Desulfonatronovibrio hydrogenovorans]